MHLSAGSCATAVGHACEVVALTVPPDAVTVVQPRRTRSTRTRASTARAGHELPGTAGFGTAGASPSDPSARRRRPMCPLPHRRCPPLHLFTVTAASPSQSPAPCANVAMSASAVPSMPPPPPPLFRHLRRPVRASMVAVFTTARIATALGDRPCCQLRLLPFRRCLCRSSDAQGRDAAGPSRAGGGMTCPTPGACFCTPKAPHSPLLAASGLLLWRSAACVLRCQRSRAWAPSCTRVAVGSCTRCPLQSSPAPVALPQ